MKRFLRRDNGHGEWTILDRTLGYRICSHHRLTHGIHVHGPDDRIVMRLPHISLVRADALVRRYARQHDVFDSELLQPEVRSWRSR